MVVLASRARGDYRVLFRPTGLGIDCGSDIFVFGAEIDWGGADNPLIAALPALISFDPAADADGGALVGVLRAELQENRCGSGAAASRLCEVLLIRMLRARIGAGATGPGLVAGLGDPRLSRAIVAIHEQPERAWRNADLAHRAGLSLSRFAQMFAQKVGMTPAAYLRQWRLTLAYRDAARGDRVDAIARRYSYGSPEGFARAFKSRFGRNPVDLRPDRAKSRV